MRMRERVSVKNTSFDALLPNKSGIKCLTWLINHTQPSWLQQIIPTIRMKKRQGNQNNRWGERKRREREGASRQTREKARERE